MSEGSADGVAVLHVVLVADLADQLLHEVLEGDDAVGAAVLVDDDGQVGAPWRIIATRGRARAWSRGTASTGRQASRDQPAGAASARRAGRARAGSPARRRSPGAGHRVARVGQVADLGRAPRARVRSPATNATSVRGRHHLLDAGLGGGEDVAEDPALLLLEVLVGRHQVAQLLLGELLAGGVRVAAEQAHQRVGRQRQQPDRPGAPGWRSGPAPARPPARPAPPSAGRAAWARARRGPGRGRR